MITWRLLSVYYNSHAICVVPDATCLEPAATRILVELGLHFLQDKSTYHIVAFYLQLVYQLYTVLMEMISLTMGVHRAVMIWRL